MHSSSLTAEPAGGKSEAEVLLAVTTLVTEGRIPDLVGLKSKGFREGPHCYSSSQTNEHKCDISDSLCADYEFFREEIFKLWEQSVPLCIEVVLTCGCQEGESVIGPETVENFLLLESWNFNISNKRLSAPPAAFKVAQLINAIRSQLYFSQITAWLTTKDEKLKRKLTNKHLRYRIALPEETFKSAKFLTNSVEHNFPSTDIGFNRILNVSFLSMSRMSLFPLVECPSCKSSQENVTPALNSNGPKENTQEENVGEKQRRMVDDRMHILCTLKGKHHCEDYEELENANKSETLAKFKRFRQNLREEQPSTSTLNHLNTCQIQNNQPRMELINTEVHNNPIHNEGCGKVDDKNCHFYNDLILTEEDRSAVLLEAIERVGIRSPEKVRNQSQGGCNKNLRHKTADSSAVFQNFCDYNPTVMDVQSENNLGEPKYNSPHGRYKVDHDNHRSDGRSCRDSEVQVEKYYVDSAKNESACDIVHCDTSKSDTSSDRNRFNVYVDKNFCDSPIPTVKQMKMKDISNRLDKTAKSKNSVKCKLTFENFEDAKLEAISHCDMLEKKTVAGGNVPTSVEQAKFRRNLGNAASMVFHSRTGLPLTSSPAPVRKGKTCFDFDSSLNSVSAIKSALFSSNCSTDDDSESDGSLVSPCSPETFLAHHQKVEEPKSPVRWQWRRKGHACSLLGSFEESVLNGRLEPVSTVQGFTAELGASGSFIPKHLVVPVTVFFYTLGDNDKISSPYLCHINLGKKGYCVPKRGTVQVTLFNPLGTVVKMFVIMYDLTDMPPNSQTFIRQRTLYMPNDCKDKNVEWGPKWLKYLIHLRFMSSKSGKIYLHSDIRVIILHKSDLDTANAHDMDLCYELRSFTLMPSNPRFSPRK